MNPLKRRPGLILNENGTVKVLKPLCLTTAEAAFYLEARGFPVAPASLEVWRCKGRGPRYKRVGRRVFYTQADLDRFLEGIKVQVIDPAQQRIRRPRKSEALA